MVATAEAVLSVIVSETELALAEGRAPPILGHLVRDPECDLPLALEPQTFDQQIVISNSSAFGGLNAGLSGRRYP